MTRKLHNTLMAAIASSSLLVVGVIISSPIASDLDTVNTDSVLVSINAQAETTTDAIDQVTDTSPQRAHSLRYRRQALAMPFFSFAPRS